MIVRPYLLQDLQKEYDATQQELADIRKNETMRRGTFHRTLEAYNKKMNEMPVGAERDAFISNVQEYEKAEDIKRAKFEVLEKIKIEALTKLKNQIDALKNSITKEIKNFSAKFKV